MADEDDKKPVLLETKIAVLAVATPLVAQVVDAATALFSADESGKS